MKTKTLEKNGQKFTVKAALHPRYWVTKTLRKAAQLALRKGDDARAKAATELMEELNEEHNLGY